MTDAEPAAPPAAPVDIPYAFARAHGVVIAEDEGGRWLATLREGSDPAVLAARSPINQLDSLKANVMLVVGGQDERVPPVHGESLHMALNKRGIAHEWLYKPGEGHGFYDEQNTTELYERLTQFLDRNIGVNGQAGNAAAVASP